MVQHVKVFALSSLSSSRVTSAKKPDTASIEAHIATLKRQPWLGQARAWWPDFLFRFDNIDAVARILSTGRLLSRARAVSEGVMIRDCASSEIIAATDRKWMECVRLYFRPRSPTQFNTEGFRPTDKYPRPGAECPVPVVMLFKALDILTRADARFSNGNLAASPEIGDDAAFLTSIPFEKVYHDSAFPPDGRGSIIFHRQAEVIVPDEMDLATLRFVGCRTEAEYETLIHLLDINTRKRWSQIIGLRTTANLHHRRWTFVENVQLSKEQITFRFNPSSTLPGPFAVEVEIKETATDLMYVLKKPDFVANSELKVGLQNLKFPENYTVELKLNQQIAYANKYEEEDIPF